MTERTLKASLTRSEVHFVIGEIMEELNRPHVTDEKRGTLKELEKKLMPLYREHDLMSRATKLYEDDRITLFEHPDHGDEVPLMAYFKGIEHFDENVDEYDADPYTVEIIMEDHRQWIKTL